MTINLFTGPYGILDLQDFSDFLLAVKPGGDTLKWGVPKDIAGNFFSLYILGMAVTYTSPIIANFVNEGSGLITTQTADYWLWRCEDPLVAYLVGAANASCMLQVNHTAQPPSTIWTGKDSTDKINSYIKWRNQTEIVGIWNGAVPVQGCTEDGQFSFHLSDGEDLKVWAEVFVKTLTFNQQGKTSLHDIDVYKYTLNETAFNASTLYTNTINGFANETAANQGVPVFLSNWDFYGVDSKYGNMTGMHPTVGNITTLLVEPITGFTLKADMKVQVNFFFPPEAVTWIDTFTQFQNVPYDAFYPVLKVWQIQEAGDYDVSKLKSQLKPLQPSFLHGLQYGISGGGILIALIGLGVVLRGVQLQKRSGYTDIQGSSYY